MDPGTAEELDELPELPYAITPHIGVEAIEGGGMAFVFGRSIHPGLIATLTVAGLGGALGSLLLSVSGASEGLVMLTALSTAGCVTLTYGALHRTTRVRAESGRLWLRTEYLPLVAYERTIPSAEISSVRRHMSLRLGGRSVYQIRAHLRNGEIVPAGHGISDKVEAASLASAMQRGLR